MCKYIFSVGLLLGVLVSSPPAWGKILSWPTGVQLGGDVLRPFQGKLYGSEGIQYELNAAIDMARYILEGDLGWGDIQWKGRNSTTDTLSSYTNNGYYFRLGLNYNLLQDTPDKNMAFLGCRYARSLFKDHLVSKVHYDSTGPTKNGNDSIDSKQDVKAYWFEAIAGVKVKIWRWLYIGGTIRYKFGLHLQYPGSHTPYDVLGWGLNDGRSIPFSINYYLSLRIPFTRNTLPSNAENK